MVSSKKKMDCHEPHPAPNEKMQGIQWTERPTGALVAAGSLWPQNSTYEMHTSLSSTCSWRRKEAMVS
jgi:hypothetical protein